MTTGTRSHNQATFSATSTPATPARRALARLDDPLAEAGLGGQVRLGPAALAAGVSGPRVAHVTPYPLPRGPGGATENERAGEVGFPLDDLLRPLERPDGGRLIELSGERSSGRTALAYRLAAGAIARGELAGWVDLPDALDPRFLRRCGASLDGLLWTRPPHARAALRAAELLVKTGFALVVVDVEGARASELARLGSAAWSRLLRAVRSARSTAVVLGPEHVSGSFSTLGLRTEGARARFDDGLFEGLEASAVVVRNRTGPSGYAWSLSVSHRPQAASS